MSVPVSVSTVVPQSSLSSLQSVLWTPKVRDCCTSRQERAQQSNEFAHERRFRARRLILALSRSRLISILFLVSHCPWQEKEDCTTSIKRLVLNPVGPWPRIGAISKSMRPPFVALPSCYPCLQLAVHAVKRRQIAS